MISGRGQAGVLLAAAVVVAALGLGPGGVAAEDGAAAGFTPEVVHLRNSPAATPASLRVVSFNVHYAPAPGALARALARQPRLCGADVFLLQEIESYPEEGESRTAKLARLLGLNYVYAPARGRERGGTHGLAILSRFPLSDIEVLELPRYDLGARTRRRIALGATVEAGPADGGTSGRRVRVYNLHLDTRINTGERLAQLEPVVEAARGQPIEEVIIGGDFNTNPFRWALRRLPLPGADQAGAVDEYMREQGFAAPLAEAGATMKKGIVGLRLDTIYVRGLEAVGEGVEREVDISDHFPLWVEVELPGVKKESEETLTGAASGRPR